MRMSNKLCNPNPFEEKWNYHRGIVIKIPGDGFVDLSRDQMEDFQQGTPGYEAVKELMDHKGLFIRDDSLSYERQALDALKASHRSKNDRYQTAVNQFRKDRAAQGITDDPVVFEENLRQIGYVRLREQMDIIKKRIDFLQSEVEEQVAENAVKPIDPDTNIPFLNPPKVFESASALKMFLNDPGNEEIKEKWQTWRDEVTRDLRNV